MNVKTYNKSYIAILDILGFKDLVNENAHQELLNIYKLFTTTINDCLADFKSNIIDNEHETKIITDLTNVKINSVIISDSIIFWSDDNSTDSFFEMLITIRHALRFGIFHGIPMRGGFTVGEFSIIDEKLDTKSYNQNITFFGKGIVDAYNLEQSQDWAGCVIHEDCIKEYNQNLQKKNK